MPRFRIALALLLLALPVRAADEPARDAEGYPLPKGAVARLGSMRLQHEKPVNVAVFTHDGKQIVSAGKDGFVRVWDATTGKAVAAWPLARVGDPVGLTLSRKGDLVLVAFGNGALHLLELDTGKTRYELSARGTPVGTTPLGAAASFGEGDKTLLTAVTDGTVTLWDLSTGKATKTNQVAGLVGRRPQVVVMPDAKTYAYEDAQRKEMLFFDAADGKEVRKFPFIDPAAPRFVPAAALAVSPDGKTLAVVRERWLSLWDAEKGKRLVDRQTDGFALKFSPDGRLLLLRHSADSLLGGLSAQELRRFRSTQTQPGYIAAISPDNKRAVLLSGTSNRVRVWDIEEEKELLGGDAFAVQATSLHWLSDGRVAAVFGTQAKVLDVATGKVLAEQTLAEPKPYTTFTARVGVTEDGKALIWAGTDDVVRVWEPGKPIKEIEGLPGAKKPEAPPPPAGMTPIGPRPATRYPGSEPLVSPNGRYYAHVVGHDNLKLRDLTADKELELSKRPNFNTSAYPQVWAFTADSKYLIGSSEGRPHLWEVATGKQMPWYDPVTERPTGVIELAGDGRSVLLGGNDHLYLCEIASGWVRIKLNLRQIDGPPPSFGSPKPLLPTCVSPDGLLVARVTPTGAIRVLPVINNVNATRGAYLEPGQGALTALAFTPDGKRLVSAGTNGTVLFWDVKPAWKETLYTGQYQKAELPDRWHDLTGNSATAFEVMARFAADPKTALAVFGEKLKPRPEPTKEDVAKWIEEIVKSKRPHALDDLIEAGPAAHEAVRKAIADLPDNISTRYTREHLSKALEGTDRIATKAELRRLRVIEVLEWIGTAEARELIEPLAKGPADNIVTRHAKAALARLAPPK